MHRAGMMRLRMPSICHNKHTLLCRAHSSSDSSRNAALLVIGNEILSGSIQDTNTAFLAKMCHGRGIDMVRVEFIPDDKKDIGTSVLALKQRVGTRGYVFTSGGIGPTHDDVTYEAIADAFGVLAPAGRLNIMYLNISTASPGVPLELHAPTVDKMRAHYAGTGQELNEARLRMATLPRNSMVLDTPGLWVPLVNLHSVFILPGVCFLGGGGLGGGCVPASIF